MTLDDGETLLDQFPSRVLFFKGDKAEVLGSITPHFVNRPDHLHHRAKLHRVVNDTDHAIKKARVTPEQSEPSLHHW